MYVAQIFTVLEISQHMLRYSYMVSELQNCNWIMKTDPNSTFGISNITNLKYLFPCKSLVLGCSHAKFTV